MTSSAPPPSGCLASSTPRPAPATRTPQDSCTPSRTGSPPPTPPPATPRPSTPPPTAAPPLTSFVALAPPPPVPPRSPQPPGQTAGPIGSAVWRSGNASLQLLRASLPTHFTVQCRRRGNA